MKHSTYDVVIIGGGPGGYAAALYCVRAGLSTLVLEKLSAGGQMATTTQVDNYPGFDEGIDGFELAEKMQRGAERFGAETEYAEVTALDLTAQPKRITTSAGEVFGRTVILATGASPRPLGIPDEDALRGRGVSYCATCDGMFFRGKTVVVAGGGNSAAEDALVLSKICKKVYLVHRRDTLRATKSYLAPLEKASNLEFVWNKQIDRLIAPDGQLTGIGMTDRVTGEVSTLETDGLFVAIGPIHDTALIACQLELDQQGYNDADENNRKTLNGDFADSHSPQKPLRQIITAASDGATASKFVEEYLNQL